MLQSNGNGGNHKNGNESANGNGNGNGADNLPHIPNIKAEYKNLSYNDVMGFI